MNVVIDTNILISTINRKNFEFFIYQEFAKNTFNWVLSTDIILEYDEKLSEKYSENTADYILKALTSTNNVIFTEPYFRWNLIIEDPDDNKFSDLAISVNADCLVTNDKHFNIFKTLDFPKLLILSPLEFKEYLEIA